MGAYSAGRKEQERSIWNNEQPLMEEPHDYCSHLQLRVSRHYTSWMSLKTVPSLVAEIKRIIPGQE